MPYIFLDPRNIISMKSSVCNDYYVHLLSRDDLRVYLINSPGMIIGVYVIARLLYPNEKWNLMSNTSFFYLLGRDHVISLYKEIDIRNSIPVCSIEQFIDIRRERDQIQFKNIISSISTYSDDEKVQASSYSISENPLRAGSPLASMVEGYPHLLPVTKDIISSRNIKGISNLPLDIYAIPSVVYSIKLHHMYSSLRKIFRDIPPHVDTRKIPIMRYPGDIFISVYGA